MPTYKQTASLVLQILKLRISTYIGKIDNLLTASPSENSNCLHQEVSKIYFKLNNSILQFRNEIF